jgi:hypothetical protein
LADKIEETKYADFDLDEDRNTGFVKVEKMISKYVWNIPTQNIIPLKGSLFNRISYGLFRFRYNEFKKYLEILKKDEDITPKNISPPHTQLQLQVLNRKLSFFSPCCCSVLMDL